MPQITPEYLATLEHLLHVTREFLAKREGIGALRQAMQAATKARDKNTPQPVDK
jgi:hypothetical protein